MNNFNPNKIRELRELNNINQKQLGNLMGINRSFVSRWEAGVSKPTGKNLICLSRVFNVPIGYFLENSDSDRIEKEDFAFYMESLTELYKTNRATLSLRRNSPEKACLVFKENNKDADKFKVILYQTLPEEGRKNYLEEVIRKAFFPYDCEVELNYVSDNIPHSNTMEIISYKKNTEKDRVKVFGIGGHSIVFDDDIDKEPEKIYTLGRFSTIAKYCEDKGIRLWQYAIENENDGFLNYMHGIWKTMKASVECGLVEIGKLLPETENEDTMIGEYVSAVSRQNASGEKIITAPTCNVAGIVPAVLYWQQRKNNFSDGSIVCALMTAGIIGNIIKTSVPKHNEHTDVVIACAMAAAAFGELLELSFDRIEYAVRTVIEQNAGVTFNWPAFKGYGYGLGVRTNISIPLSGSTGNLKEFGWGGAAGANVFIDVDDDYSGSEKFV